MAPSSKPKFVVFPGAFHNVEIFGMLKNLIEEKHDYKCILSENAPSLGSNDKDLADDVSFFRNQVILPLLENGDNLVLVLHSYAGASAGGAVAGLTLPERQKANLKGGVLGLICVSAICVPVGLTIQDTLQMTDELAPWTSVDMENGSVSVKSEEIGIQQFYTHLPITEAQYWAKRLQPQAFQIFKTTATYSPWTDPAWNGKTAFLICEDDQTFPSQLQEFFIQAGNFKFVKSLPTSHSAFLDMPKETVEVLVDFANCFEQVD